MIRTLVSAAVCGVPAALFAPALSFAGSETTIDIADFAFSPAETRIKVGSKVLFVNRDETPHNVVDKKGSFRSKALDTGERFSVVFDKPGEISFFCGLHPQMTGRIVVTPQ